MATIGDRAQVAYVSSVDAPLLHPAFVRAVVGAVDPGIDVAVPDVDGHRGAVRNVERLRRGQLGVFDGLSGESVLDWRLR